MNFAISSNSQLEMLKNQDNLYFLSLRNNRYFYCLKGLQIKTNHYIQKLFEICTEGAWNQLFNTTTKFSDQKNSRRKDLQKYMIRADSQIKAQLKTVRFQCRNQLSKIIDHQMKLDYFQARDYYQSSNKKQVEEQCIKDLANLSLKISQYIGVIQQQIVTLENLI